MKRLALTGMAITAVVAGSIVPAFGDEAPERFRKGDSWCERHAKNVVDVDAGGQAGLVVGGGSYLDRPVTSAYACYDLKVGGERRGELVSAYLDPEYGEAGLTCVKQPGSPKSCKKTPVDLPFEGTTPFGHDGEPWWLHLFGLELRYGLDGGVLRAGAGGTSCVPGTSTCATVQERRASAGPDVRYRARGYECAVGDGSCTRTEAGDVAVLLEEDRPLVTVDQATVDAPGLCAGLAVDPRC